MEKQTIEMYGVKPVQHNPPVEMMTDQQLLQKLEWWERQERLAHARCDNNKGSSCVAAFNACWRKCQRLLKELEDERWRRGL